MALVSALLPHLQRALKTHLHVLTEPALLPSTLRFPGSPFFHARQSRFGPSSPAAGGGAGQKQRARYWGLLSYSRMQLCFGNKHVLCRLRLSHMRLERPRQWGGCWLALQLWRELELNEFWSEHLAPSRKGTRWSDVLLILVVYRLLSPGSEWRLHREWCLPAIPPITPRESRGKSSGKRVGKKNLRFSRKL
jgi:hypothetical protein